MAFFRLGDKASSFTDTVSGKKVLEGQAVEFTGKQRKTQRFLEATKHKHLIECEADHFKKDQEDEVEETSELLTQKAFDKLKVDAKKEYLKDNFEDLDEADIEEIDEMTGPQLNEKFAELISDEDEDEEED